MKGFVTVIGRDKVGIVAKVSAFLLERGGNIEEISQTVLQDNFVMIMLAEMSEGVKTAELNQQLSELGREMGLSIRFQREEIFNAMHTV